MRRIRFATIAEFGLGLFVAVAVGVTLYLSGAAGVRSTQTLLAQQAEAQLDALEHRLDTLLKPVSEQAEWIARAFDDGTADSSHPARLDAFMQGALGAAAQVSALAVIDPRAQVRRWTRSARQGASEDWSKRPGVAEFAATGGERAGRSWRAPIRGPISGAAVLLHDNPLRRDGRYVGMLVQVVPVAMLSREFVMAASEAGVTPFILYGGDRVLAHPRLPPLAGADDAPLPAVGSFGDAVLAEFLKPAARSPFGLRRVTRAQATSAKVGESRYVYFSRRIERFGDVPLTVGAYFSAEESARGDELRRLIQALAAGLGVLIVAVLAAAYAGRRLSAPVQELARASKAVEEGELDEIPQLRGSAIAEFDDASRSFNRMVRGLHERELYRRTLGRFVSKEVARRLMRGGGKLEPVEAVATVLVCDIEDFTPLTQSLGPARVVEFLNAYFQVMVSIVEKHSGTITQFQGDAILSVFNVPIENPDHARHAVEAAIEMAAATRQEFAGVRIANRIGVCTGNLVAGAVGARGRLSYTVHGNVVNIAARLEKLNKAHATRILVAESTAQLCPPGLLREVAEVTLRGYGERLRVYTGA
jgi:class 3 adenylate cyclase